MITSFPILYCLLKLLQWIYIHADMLEMCLIYVSYMAGFSYRKPHNSYSSLYIISDIVFISIYVCHSFVSYLYFSYLLCFWILLKLLYICDLVHTAQSINMQFNTAGTGHIMYPKSMCVRFWFTLGCTGLYAQCTCGSVCTMYVHIRTYIVRTDP